MSPHPNLALHECLSQLKYSSGLLGGQTHLGQVKLQHGETRWIEQLGLLKQILLRKSSAALHHRRKTVHPALVLLHELVEEPSLH